MIRVHAIRNEDQINVNLNGKSYFVNCINEEDVNRVMSAVHVLKTNPTQDNADQVESLISPSAKLSQNKYLERDRRGNWYLKGYNVPMPGDLVQRILDYLDQDYPVEALVNFWKLCLLNPDDEARRRLFRFASTYGFPITDNGYFIAYKSVAFKGVQQRDYAMKISQTFINMKAYGKQNPADYFVFEWENDEELRTEIMNEEEYNQFLEEHVGSQEVPVVEYEEFLKEKDIQALAQIRQLSQTGLLDDSYQDTVKEAALEQGFIEEEPVAKWEKEYKFKKLGNLETLFGQISELFEEEEQLFTDWYTQRSTIKIGEPVDMPREDCDSDHHRTCSAGLHVGSTEYVAHFGCSNSFILAVLVSPADVVAVPEDYEWQKMRTCRYYPYAVCEKNDDGSVVELDTQYFESDYIQYEKQTLEQSLEELGRMKKEENMDNEDVEEITKLESFTKSRLIDIND